MKITYLVLDDERLLRNQFVKHIRKKYLQPGDQLLDYGDADTLIHDLPKMKPPLDVCILDVNMPWVNNGIDACQAIKKASPGSKVYMLTSSGDDMTRQLCMDAGAEEVVIKPQGRIGMKAALEGIVDAARGHSANPFDTNN